MPLMLPSADYDDYMMLTHSLEGATQRSPVVIEQPSSINNVYDTESLANAKVSARQQCVYEDP